jgi:DNA-binding NtrC family response regulator
MSEGSETYHEAVARFKREFLAEALQSHGGNRTRTARTVGLQRTYLIRLLREFGLTQPAILKRMPGRISLCR